MTYHYSLLTFRNSRIGALSSAFCGYLLIVVARGWSGIDQIPSDPGYDYIWTQKSAGLSVVSTSPYLHTDAPVIAAIASLFPIEFHGFAAAITTHLVWSTSSLVLFNALRHFTIGTATSLVGGLLLVTVPWAAQSAIGNYGNVRWPIFVAVVVVISAEVAHRQPRVIPMTLAALVITVTNPLHPLLLVPLMIGAKTLASKHRMALSIAALPLLCGLLFNMSNARIDGHSEKIVSFWEGAGLFWVSGQVLPSVIALIGLILTVRRLRGRSERQLFAFNLFVMVILAASASFQLGGIADRYYIAPFTLSAIGALVLLSDGRARSAMFTRVAVVAIGVMLLIPTMRWFFVFPYLRSAQGWSKQIELAREQCVTGTVSFVELVTSDGESKTDPIPCKDL